MLKHVTAAAGLRGLATRRAKPDEFRSVRHALVEEETAKGGWSVAKKNKTTTRLRRPKAHDKALEDRVWTLMYRMGFVYLSEEGGAYQVLNADDPEGPDNQIDVVAIDDEVAFAIECKSSTRPKKFGDFSGDLAKHVGLRERFTRSVREQFPTEARRPCVFVFWTSSIIVTDNDRTRAKVDHVQLLDENDLEYYEQLASQIGTAARFQFLADVLEGRSVPGLEITVPAIRTRMGAFTAYSFSVTPEYLLKIAFVSHRARGKASDIDAYQRMLKKGRLRSIREYITEGGIFPTNIVVNIAEAKWLTFDRGKQEADHKSSLFGWLNLRPAYRVAWVIDGQHRLFAYANHPMAAKSLISVMAFVGLPASEQARLFVDINAQQRKVKQSLLQELYAELHWDADDPEVRVQAILSKVIQALDVELNSPFRGRVLKADDPRSDIRCISLTSVFRAMEKSHFFIARTKKGEVTEYGPLWNVDNTATMKRTIAVLVAYFEVIRAQVPELWDKGSAEGGGLSMNDGVTVCINVLRSIFQHIQAVKKANVHDFDDHELAEVLKPYALLVGRHFASLTSEGMMHFRSLRGSQGQTAGTRRVEEYIRREDPEFDPPGLREHLDREKAQTTTRAFEEINAIENMLQATIVSELKREFGDKETEWFFNGVPKSVRKKVDDRINEEGGKKGGREHGFDLIDYREIIVDQWELFESTFARGAKGSKDARTKWMVEMNEVRKSVMHATKGITLPVTEDQLAFLQDVRQWLGSQINEPPST